MKTRVIKVGGSLFADHRLPGQLRIWLTQLTAQRNVFLAGGGGFANEVRRLDRKFDLGQSWCHWLCIDLLATSERILGRLLPELDRVDDLDQLRGKGNWLLNPVPWLRNDTSLPQTWAVTSDSIAALLARRIKADELILLKSTCPDCLDSVAQLVDEGIVDPGFEKSSGGIRTVKVVDLLDRGFRSVSVQPVASAS